MKQYQIMHSIKIMFCVRFIKLIREKAKIGKIGKKRYEESQLIKLIYLFIYLFFGMIVE